MYLFILGARMNIKSTGFIFFALLSLFLVDLPGPARAGVVLPDAGANIVLAGAVNYRSVGMDVQSGYQGALGPPSGSASYAGSLGPSPNIYASLSLASAGPADQSVYNQLVYYFEVITPTTTNVPIVVNAAGSVLPAAGLSSTLSVDLSGEPTIASITCNNACSTSSFSVSTARTIQSNALYEILLGISLVANVNPSGSIITNASIDPTIAIDPSFLANNPGASLVFSAGVGNVSAVPELSTWAMMLAGFLGLGFLGYRHQNKTA